MNAFACSMYARLARTPGNLFFSPYSVACALAMAAEGARGGTAREMAAVLGVAVAGDDGVDWSGLHAFLAQQAERLAPKPPAPALLERLAQLRAGLETLNARLRQDEERGDAYHEGAEASQRLAADIDALQAQVDPTEFRSANALWLERTTSLEAPYLEAISRWYGTDGARPADFAHDPEGSRTAINDWVAGQTRQRIHDLLGRGAITAATRLVLANAVTFLGEWLEPFDPEDTREEAFFPAEGGRVPTPLMHGVQADGARYAAFRKDGTPFPTPAQVELRNVDKGTLYPDDGFQLLELPYRGGALVMQVLLPMRADGLSRVQRLLGAGALERWDAALETREVDVRLPKFRLESQFELNEALEALGMPRAFANPARSQQGAQFEGISDPADPDERLYIGLVAHKAFVAVDEKGTEAAAATAIAMAAACGIPALVDFTPVFRADRPFVFLIRDRGTGAVLFMGRYARPPGADAL